MALAYRVQHPDGSRGFQLVNGTPIDYVVAQEQVVEDGKPKVDDSGQPVMQNKMDDKTGDPVPEMKDGKPVPFILSYGADDAVTHGPRRRGPPEGPDAALPVPPDRRVGRRAARLLVHVHPGVRRDPDPGRVRVGHVDG